MELIPFNNIFVLNKFLYDYQIQDKSEKQKLDDDIKKLMESKQNSDLSKTNILLKNNSLGGDL